jgi:uncharacterized RDD family membrane protein YckC
LEFFDGEIVLFDWTVHVTIGNVLTEITTSVAFGFYRFSVIETGTPGARTVTGEVVLDEIGTVPLPAAHPLFTAGFGLHGLFQRRRTRRGSINFS